jgi:uncharacterized protein (DUF2336 family)
MPAAQTAHIHDLEQALAGVPLAKYVETARRVVEFFVAGAAQFSDEHVGVFDRVLGRMIGALDNRALAELARRLAPLRNAPPVVMRRLAANPDITVAAPVLARSPRLCDDDLWVVATARSAAHQLVISGRPGLSETVTGVLVECGDRDVVRNLALNHGARLSGPGMATLVKRATRDAILAEKLVQREDVAPDLLRHLVANSPEDVRARLLAVMRPELRGEIASLAATGSRDLAEGVEDSDAWRRVRALKLAGRLGEVEVLGYAQTGRRHETAAALALMCDMSVDVVRQLMRGDQPEAALILCQAAGISWPAAQAIVAAGNGKPMAKGTAAFDRLSPTTAREIVGLWRAAG